MRSSITERSFHGIPLFPPFEGKSVTYVSSTFCYLCLGSLINNLQATARRFVLILVFRAALNGVKKECGEYMRLI